MGAVALDGVVGFEPFLDQACRVCSKESVSYIFYIADILYVREVAMNARSCFTHVSIFCFERR